MDLKHLSDKNLLLAMDGLVQRERETLTALLHHLREIDRRLLYSTLKFRSLFAYTVGHLRYPEDQAYRRIAAMKLLREIPEVESKIKSGALSLTNIGLAQSHFRREKASTQKEFSKQEKLEILHELENKSTREAEKIVFGMSSAPFLAHERVKQSSEESVEFRFTAPDRLLKKVEQLKGLLAHKYPNISLAELFEKLCDLGLETWDPAKQTNREKTAAAKKHCEKTEAPNSSTSALAPDIEQTRRENQTAPKAKPGTSEKPSTRYIPQATRRTVWRNAQGRCENCGSTYALQVEHIIPFAKGGASTLENLKLLCRACNQRRAMQEFGVYKMAQFWKF